MFRRWPPLLLACSLVFAFSHVVQAAEYVIITRESLAAEFQRLADYRTAHGLPAEVRTVESIDAQYPGGVDAAERVRLYLQDAYAQSGTLWVLLGGDAEVVPVRYARSSLYNLEEMILSDSYFMCLDGTWNADGDAFFGEIEDEVDLAPELFIGRAPVSDALEVHLFVDKTIVYENQTPGSAYPNSALFMAERIFQNLHGAELAEPAIDALPPFFEVVRLYEEAKNWPGALPLNRAAAIDAMNQGFGIVQHIGHSEEDYWSLGDDVLTPADVDQLTNGPLYSVVYTFNSESAAFDVDDAMGEHWLTSPQGGAVALIGSSAYIYINAWRDIEAEWLRLVFEDSVPALGVVSALARLPFVQLGQSESAFRQTLFSFTLLGDPALELRGAGTTGVAGDGAPAHPLELSVSPNPFTASTSIALDTGAGDAVRVGIYDAAGRLVRDLAQGVRGRAVIRWDGKAQSGDLAPGVYFLRLDSAAGTATHKLVRVR